MPLMSKLPDAKARAEALNPAGSYIVQAPAGSGKTGLLIRRFLVLLAQVERPEEILAITFTRKAAGEMTTRIAEALAAVADPAPTDPAEREIWELAGNAVARSNEKGWNLTENPGRLQVLTFDAFCMFLARRMPFLSGLGGEPSVTEQAGVLYREAGKAVFDSLADPNHGASARRLLDWLDNDMGAAATQIAEMLGSRAQWLRHFSGHPDGEAFLAQVEQAFTRAIRFALEPLADSAPPLPGLWACARRAADHVVAGHAIAALSGISTWPTADPADLPLWRGLADLFLTNTGTVRKKVDPTHGFSADDEPAKAMKAAMVELFAVLADYPDWVDMLHATRSLPDPQMSEDLRETLADLAVALWASVDKLEQTFIASGRMDYPRVAQAALDALGAEGHPTDLALTLDYRIQHILVDEFQDTDYRQHDLLCRLTAGWEAGDGRTLFLVGDPMQSIYSFRNAEVGLFIKAWQGGLSHLPLAPLVLSANFRSTPELIGWFNDTFARTFPATDEIGSGQVSYSPCAPGRGEADTGPIQPLNPLPGRDDGGEAAQIVAHVAAARKADPDGSIAVLVRARSHLAQIIPALATAGVAARAVEIDPLADQPVIMDLLSLTRALVDPADRVAWLAVLRAPWCALSVADLAALAEGENKKTIRDLLKDKDRMARLSDTGRARAKRLWQVLSDAIDRRGARTLNRRVEVAWTALNGPAVIEPEGLAHAERFFSLLADLEEGGEPPSLSLLTEQVAELKAEATTDALVEVLTIHKAKGLAWDTVIVPGLGRNAPNEQKKLLVWQERPNVSVDAPPDLLIAPVGRRGGKDAPFYAYIRGLNQTRRSNENTRLLYVAATRAKKRLHLLGHAKLRADGNFRPDKNSLLACMWKVAAPLFDGLEPHAQAVEEEIKPLPLRRLPDSFTPPVPAPSVVALSADAEPDPPREFSWAGEAARVVGTVTHRALEGIVKNGLGAWSPARVDQSTPSYLAALMGEGLPKEVAETAVPQVVKALKTALTDPKGKWILGDHPNAEAEYDLTGVLNGRQVRGIIDRTFVADGVRWIIDYKTSAHEGGGVEAFLDNEKQEYQKKMEEYAALLSAMDDRPIRLGLYFPLLSGWREWGWEGTSLKAVAPPF